MRLGLPNRRKWHEREEKAYTLMFIAAAWLLVFGFGPFLAVNVAAMVTGVYEEDGYPAFTLLSPLLVVPAVLLAAVVVITFTAPLKRPQGLARWEVTLVAFVGMCIHAVCISLDEPFLSDSMATFAVVVLLLYVAVWAVSVLRSAAGWLRLVPRSWRVEDTRNLSPLRQPAKEDAP